MSEKTPHLSFPCEFPIKVMGKAGLEFEALVLNIIRSHAPDLGEASVTTRPSKDGNFVSVTATITATSQQQLDAIYADLSAEKKVLMAL